MFVPVVPQLKNANVVNKEIVYDDYVLSLNELGANLCVYCVCGVGEYSLEDCLRIILKDNPDVLFNTIQYSKRDKRVYFYTDKDINIKGWEDRTVRKFKPLESNAEVLKEIKSILQSKDNKENSCISIYDVRKLLKQKSNELKNLKVKYERKLKSTLLRYSSFSESSIILHDFRYGNNELILSFKDYYWNDEWDHFAFSKKDGDLYIVKCDGFYAEKNVAKFFYRVGDVLSEAYDEMLKFEDFEKGSVNGIMSINSNFYVNISKYGVSVKGNGAENANFYLYGWIYNDDYELNCNSSKVISAIKGNENVLFKKLFINIEDCPFWMRDELYKIRKKQLGYEVEEKVKKKRKLKIFSFL